MYLTDVIAELEERGLVEVAGISEQGEFLYQAKQP